MLFCIFHTRHLRVRIYFFFTHLQLSSWVSRVHTRLVKAMPTLYFDQYHRHINIITVTIVVIDVVSCDIRRYIIQAFCIVTFKMKVIEIFSSCFTSKPGYKVKCFNIVLNTVWDKYSTLAVNLEFLVITCKWFWNKV